MSFKNKFLFFIIIFSLCPHIFFSATENDSNNPFCEIEKTSDFYGTALCDEMYKYLTKNDIEVQTQNLVANGTNYFPYNIIIENNCQKDSLSKINEIFILVFSIEEAYKNKEIILSTAQTLKTKSFPSKILLSYGENSIIKNDTTITGSQVFIKSLNTNEVHYVFIINLASEKNGIIQGSKGISAPSWMIKTAFSTFTEQKIKSNISSYYISQFSKYSFLNDDLLNSFLQNNIPAIKINLKKTDDEIHKISDLLSQNNNKDDIKNTKQKDKTETDTDSFSFSVNYLNNLIENYSSEEIKNNDYHSLMFRFFKFTIWLTESAIVRIIVFSIFLSLLFIFLLGLFNSNLKTDAWKQIKSNWYTIPVILTLSICGFFLGRLIYNIFYTKSPETGTVYGILLLQIMISSFFVSLFFLLELFFHKSYGAKSIDFLILISTFGNQYLFCLADLSLFPFFFFICLLAVLSLIVRRNWTHIVLFFFLILTFVPYIFTLYNLTDAYILRLSFLENKMISVTVPLILLPIYLMLLRIFTAVKQKFSQKKVFLLIVSSTYVFFYSILFLFNYLFFNNKPILPEKLSITQASENFLTVSYSDNLVFSDIIRTINISSTIEPKIISLQIENISDTDSFPVLYSQNDYISTQKNSVAFLIPENPPQNLSFTYGTDTKKAKIIVELLYMQNEKYYSCKNELITQ